MSDRASRRLPWTWSSPSPSALRRLISVTSSPAMTVAGRHAGSVRVVDTTYFGNALRCRASTSSGSVTCGQYDASIS